ncbi:MAG: 30S ribosomal protein S16 [Patescibacteria group bacterium]
MLHIRLTRIGKKKQPEYRVIVCEKARDPWGRAKEILGHYNPLTNPATINLKKDRIEYWINNGAQCSETVWNLLVDQGIVKGDKKKTIKISDKRREALAKKQPKQEKPAEAPKAAPATEAPKAEKPAEAPAEAEKPVEAEPAMEAPEEEKPADEAQKSE